MDVVKATELVYDPTGKRLSMTDVTGTTSYLYDPYTGQLKQMTYADGRTLTLDYDDNGNRVQMTGPFGHATHYAYDNLNRLLSVGSNPQEPDAVYSYQLNGLPEQVELVNGTSSQYHYSGMQLSKRRAVYK